MWLLDTEAQRLVQQLWQPATTTRRATQGRSNLGKDERRKGDVAAGKGKARNNLAGAGQGMSDEANKLGKWAAEPPKVEGSTKSVEFAGGFVVTPSSRKERRKTN